MPSFLRNVKLGSLTVWPAVLGLVACVGLGSTTTGCIIVDDDDDDTVIIDDGPRPSEVPMEMSIETDVQLDAVPGDGVGVFVEYYSSGVYRVWTTCDTSFSGAVCPMDIFMSVDTSSTIDAITTDDLEGADHVNINEAAGTVDLHVDTGVDYDALEISTTPGAILRLEVLIDGVPQPRFVYWFGNGVLHNGAPTSPVDFVPTVP
ncbi:hypothetical protein [Polyangium jinanense]|uniref:Lipoprotein n=1 Tax=Polyangium jinanense TaxID=2829994 RepID=A0A9X3XFW2_9BACT|nr:hypothetical protein [Polyangium jinanense]MDC3961696.1 hypothetical protein [Polyangium jinanense]MDC3983917.1 hypothetical protein [Polyangium jinanense]MDC3987256.1 hypothetical protein [Polyangium jinanense]